MSIDDGKWSFALYATAMTAAANRECKNTLSGWTTKSESYLGEKKAKIKTPNIPQLSKRARILEKKPP